MCGIFNQEHFNGHSLATVLPFKENLNSFLYVLENMCGIQKTAEQKQLMEKNFFVWSMVR